MSRRQSTPDPYEREHYRLLVVDKSRDTVHLGDLGAWAERLCVYNVRQTNSIRSLSEFEDIAQVCTNCREVSDKRKANDSPPD